MSIESEIAKIIDHSRWLMNNGIIPDSAKNQLFMYGAIVHKEVKAVDVRIDSEKRNIHYTIYVDKSVLKKIKKFERLRTSKTLIGLWLLKRFLKKEGNLDFKAILTSFVKDFCGGRWGAIVEVADYADYKEETVDVEGNTTSGII